MPGVAGVGSQAQGGSMPCIGCYGAPAGAIVLPPSFYVIAPAEQEGVIFYNTVETGNVGGAASFSLEITESETGKVVLTFTDTGSLPANSTNIISWTTLLTDTDGYRGREKVVYTTTVGA
jgi:hypothetical protein